jgi:hypothetical protein
MKKNIFTWFSFLLICQRQKNSGTNALAYFVVASVMKKPIFTWFLFFRFFTFEAADGNKMDEQKVRKEKLSPF